MLIEEIIVDVSGEEGQNILTLKSTAIARFIHIMTSLSRVYSLNLTNLHIFYDTKGVLIAFNRNGSIFLNLRYYEAWRKCACYYHQHLLMFMWNILQMIPKSGKETWTTL